MQVNNIAINNIWTPVLMITSDTEQAYDSVIEDGNRRYSVTHLRSWQEDGKYHYWYVINSTEIVNAALQQAVDGLTQANTALGQQVTALSLAGAQKDTLITQLGQQVAELTLSIAALQGGAST